MNKEGNTPIKKYYTLALVYILILSFFYVKAKQNYLKFSIITYSHLSEEQKDI